MVQLSEVKEIVPNQGQDGWVGHYRDDFDNFLVEITQDGDLVQMKVLKVTSYTTPQNFKLHSCVKSQVFYSGRRYGVISWYSLHLTSTADTFVGNYDQICVSVKTGHVYGYRAYDGHN